jgi:hypothetical protein
MKQFLFSALIIFCTILSQAQPTAGLVAYWPMNGNFTDAGPNNISGTNFGATATTNYISSANAAMNFSNPGTALIVPQYATHPINANLSFGINQDFTIDFSVLTTSYPHPGGIYDNNLNYGGPGVFMWNANGFPQLVFNFKNASALTTNGALPLNVWKHVACVRAGAVTRIYVNGVLNVTAAPGTWTPAYNFPARFGTMFFNGYTPPQYNGHNGKIDEFRIYNRALTAAEILTLFSVTLPVKLTSFTAVNNNNNIKLQWQTQYEQNSSHYNIQRSTDGINFTNVARVTAAGNSNIPLTYNQTDLLPAMFLNMPTVFYRLQAVDIDGQFSNSKVVAVHLNKTDMQLLVSPNPAKDILQVQTGNGVTGNATLMISDATGRQVYKKEILLQQGSNTMPVNISLLSSGIYYVRLTNANESFTKQFLKE